MNKRLISSLLLGLFLIGSTSTFTSCTDYDDDISDLRNQITTNATDLNSLVEAKTSNIEREIAALNSQASALETAYKNADNALEEAVKNATNDAKGYADIQAAEAQKAAVAAAQKLVEDAVKNLENALDAANAKIDEQGKTLASLVEADGELQKGINGAQARADQAYTLAEQAYSLAGQADEQTKANKEELGKIANDIKTINGTLEDIQNSLNVLGEGIKNVADMTENNAAEIAAQETALNNLKESNEKTLEALATTDTELRKLIEANQTKITALEKGIADAKRNAEKALEDAKSYTDTEIQNLKDEMAKLPTVEGINIKIDALEKAYAAADKKLEDSIKALEKRVKANEDDIKKINATITNINSMLAALLCGNVNNLITSIIYQQTDNYNVYAKVNGYDFGGDEYKVVEKGVTYGVFPYKTYKGYEKLEAGSFNIQEWAGDIYATINPTDIDATKAHIKLENSIGGGSELYTLGTPEPASNHLITTRAAKSENGLWRIPVTSKVSMNDDGENKWQNDKVLYALYADYEQDTLNTATGKLEKVTKKVYSHYAINLNPKQVYGIGSSSLSVKPEETNVAEKNGRIEFPATTGGLLLGTTDERVYKKFVECTDVKFNGKTVSGASKAFNEANKGVLSTILSADNEGKDDAISLTCPKQYINYVITLKYYVWNYNGKVVTMEKEIVFNESLWGPDDVNVTATPEWDAANNAVVCADYAQGLSDKPFIKGEKAETTGKAWKEEAKYYLATYESGSEAMKDAKIYLQDSKKTNNLVVVNVEDADAQQHSFGNLDISKIKEAKVSVDLAGKNKGIEPEKEYNVQLSFYNSEHYLVNIVRITYKVVLPEANLEPWKVGSAFYTDKDTYAWAVPSVDPNGGAKYNMAGSLYPLEKNGVCQKFGGLSPYSYNYAVPADYATNGKFEDYATGARLLTLSNFSSYTMCVPACALNGKANYIKPATGDVDAAKKVFVEHPYDMVFGIKFFDLDNLNSIYTKDGWHKDFTIRFLSPIRYAILGTEGYITGKEYTGVKVNKPLKVDYMGSSLKIDNNTFTLLDPSYTKDTKVNLFGTAKDSRIKGNVNIAVVPDANGNDALIAKVTPVADGYTITTSNNVSVVKDTDVTFRATVTDIWGAVTEFEFIVTVNDNK